MALRGTIEIQGVTITLESLRAAVESVLRGFPSLVDEALQETWIRIRLHDAPELIRDPAAYIATTARNIAHNLRDREKRRQQETEQPDRDNSLLEVPDPDPEITPESINERISVCALLRAIEKELTSRQVKIFGLALEGWKPREIWKYLGISKSTFYNERARIREAIKALGPPDDDSTPPDDFGGGGGGGAVRLPPVRGDPALMLDFLHRIQPRNLEPIKENADALYDSRLAFRQDIEGDTRMGITNPNRRWEGRPQDVEIKAEQLEEFKGLLLQLPGLRDDRSSSKSSSVKSLEDILTRLGAV